jgi:hypothetical protein
LRIATAAIVVDITIGLITKVIFIVASSILLVATTGRTDLTRPALVAVLTGILASQVVFVFLQGWLVSLTFRSFTSTLLLPLLLA